MGASDDLRAEGDAAPPGDTASQAKSQEALETGTFNAAKDGLAVANQLVVVVRDIQKKLVQLRKDTKLSRKFIIGLAISISLDVTLSVVTIFLAIGLNSTSTNQRVTTQQVNYQQCQQSNIDRAQDKEVWDVFLGDLIPKGTKLTPKLQTELTHVYSIIDSKDASHDCAAFLR